VATDWAPVVQTAIGAIAAISGGVVGAWLQGRHQQRTERDRRRERSGEILAEITALLDDADPGSLELDASPDSYNKTLVRLSERRSTIRLRLLTLAASHPSRDVRDLAGRLDRALLESLGTTGLYLDDLVGRGIQPSLDDVIFGRVKEAAEAERDAKQDYDEALRLLAQLVEAIQRA
jgi:hypothetical protein